MIPSVGETAAGFTAAIRLARFDAGAAALLKDDPGVAMRSFWAMAPVFPVYLYIQAMLGLIEVPHAGFWVAVMAIAFIAEWCGFLLIVSHIAESAGRGERLMRFVIAYNWGQLFAAIATLAALTLETATGPNAGNPILFATFIYLLFYIGFVVRAVLGFSGPAAAGVAFLSLLVNELAGMAAAVVLL